MAKRIKKIVASSTKRTPLRRVLMAALNWARQEIDDERFAEAIKNAALSLSRKDDAI
jgi:hypothetical protein